ncbi:MAG: glycoprotein [Carlia munda bornavirus]|uniref:Glycoprotein n=1 Tax=Carlia munda bornavirus TaxID=3141953 RepID=A0AAU7SSD2_9MONO
MESQHTRTQSGPTCTMTWEMKRVPRQFMQALRSFKLVLLMWLLGLYAEASGLPALSCNTLTTPSIQPLSTERICHEKSENGNVSCEVSYRNHFSKSLNATHISCHEYRCKTYWGFFGSYSSDKMIYKYTGDMAPCHNETVDDPFICNWYYCCRPVRMTVCRCQISRVIVVARSISPHMYCSFADCSTVSSEEIRAGYANLSDGSLLTFDGIELEPEWKNITTQGTVTCGGGTESTLIDKFRGSYPTVNGTFESDSMKISCNTSSSCDKRRRSKRDLAAVNYALHRIQPILKDSWEDCYLEQAVLGAIFSSQQATTSIFLRRWLRIPNIVGYVVGDIALVWPCRVVNVSLASWNESTYYPPCIYNGKVLYVNEELRLQDSSPEARPGLRRLLNFNGTYYLGVVGSNTVPKPITFNSSSHDYHLDEFADLINMTVEEEFRIGHETNPINHAYGTQAGLSGYTRSSNLSSVDTGSGWIHIGLPSFAFLNPLGWLRDLTSWAAWLGGILYLVSLCISLPGLIRRRRALGVWRR